MTSLFNEVNDRAPSLTFQKAEQTNKNGSRRLSEQEIQPIDLTVSKQNMIKKSLEIPIQIPIGAFLLIQSKKISCLSSPH